jgi:hypothetical protein
MQLKEDHLVVKVIVSPENDIDQAFFSTYHCSENFNPLFTFLNHEDLNIFDQWEWDVPSLLWRTIKRKVNNVVHVSFTSIP